VSPTSDALWLMPRLLKGPMLCLVLPPFQNIGCIMSRYMWIFHQIIAWTNFFHMTGDHNNGTTQWVVLMCTSEICLKIVDHSIYIFAHCGLSPCVNNKNLQWTSLLLVSCQVLTICSRLAFYSAFPFLGCGELQAWSSQ